MLSKLSTRTWISLYLLLAGSYLICLTWLPYSFAFLHKSAPILLLAAWASITTTGQTRMLLVTAALFSAAGDILLSLPLANGFVYGLGAFLIAHLFYLANFSRYFVWQNRQLPVALLLLICVAGLLSQLLPQLGKMSIPVLLYVAVITLMALMAIFASADTTAVLNNNIITTNHRLLMLGAGSFMISDGLIAWNKFIATLPYDSLLVMSSYYLAQFCIMKACITMFDKKLEHAHFAPAN